MKRELKRDWIGKQVRLKVDAEIQSGSIFPAGTVCVVTGVYRGFNLEYVEACSQCRLKFRNRICCIAYDDVGVAI
jgi:hypothetical protein